MKVENIMLSNNVLIDQRAFVIWGVVSVDLNTPNGKFCEYQDTTRIFGRDNNIFARTKEDAIEIWINKWICYLTWLFSKPLNSFLHFTLYSIKEYNLVEIE